MLSNILSMKLRLRYLLLAGLMMAAFADPVRANEISSTPCLTKAAMKLKPQKEIILIGYDTSSIRGRLVQIDLNQSAITISRIINNDVVDTTINAGTIARIKFRHARLRPGYMVLGALATPLMVGAIGGIAGWSTGSGWGGMEKGVAITLGSIGAGLVLGTVLPLLFPGYETIRCDL